MLIQGDCKDVLKNYPDNHFDLIVTDPPYGIEFMGKDWDKAIPSIDIWKECFRVLKEGKLAFIMCSPRQDVLSRMIINLEDAGFRTNYTSIYWTFASGFPKAANISKLIDKRNGRVQQDYKQLGDYIKQKRIESGKTTKHISSLFPSKTGGLTGCLWNWENAENIPTKEQWQLLKQELNLDNKFDELIERTEAEREILEKKWRTPANPEYCNTSHEYGFGKKSGGNYNITKPATEEAIKMEGAYVGFQPKPAVEVILVVSKGKTLTWLDDCRIPYQSADDKPSAGIRTGEPQPMSWGKEPNGLGWSNNQKGRFPANLLVSDDVLNDGKITKSTGGTRRPNYRKYTEGLGYDRIVNPTKISDTWLSGYGDSGSYSRYFDLDKWFDTFPFKITPKASKSERGEFNKHPTVKPIKLLSYLITLGSRENDLVLDPFVGSGTSYLAATQLNRNCIGIEINSEYIEIAKARVKPLLEQTKLV